MEPQKGHDNLTAKNAKTNHSVMGRRGDALRLVRADTAALPSFLRELGGNSAGGKRARAERFGDVPFRGLKPHGYRRTVAPRQEKPGTSRPRCKFLKFFLTGNGCVRVCSLPLAMASGGGQKSEVRGLPNLGRVALARRGFFDIGRAEARAERKSRAMGAEPSKRRLFDEGKGYAMLKRAGKSGSRQ